MIKVYFFIFFFVVFYIFRGMSCSITIIVPIRKGQLILTGEFYSSAIVHDRRDIIPRNQEKFSPSSLLDRSWSRPVTDSNTGLRVESRATRTSFILRQGFPSRRLVIFLKRAKNVTTVESQSGESAAGLEIFSQPCQPIVNSGIISTSVTWHLRFRFTKTQPRLTIKCLQFTNCIQIKINKKIWST